MVDGGGGYFDKIMKKAEKYAQGGRNDRNTGESECAFDDDPMREKSSVRLRAIEERVIFG